MEDYQAQGMGCTTKWDSCIQRAAVKRLIRFNCPQLISRNWTLYRARTKWFAHVGDWLLLRYPTKCKVSRVHVYSTQVAALGTLPYIQIFEDKDSVFRQALPSITTHSWDYCLSERWQYQAICYTKLGFEMIAALKSILCFFKPEMMRLKEGDVALD